jgi:hypothetical protein
MPEELKEAYRDYRDGRISRREFMQKAIIITGSLAAANSLVRGLASGDANAAQSAPGDPEILIHNVEYQGKAGTVWAYLARPCEGGKVSRNYRHSRKSGIERSHSRHRAPPGQGALRRACAGFLVEARGNHESQPKGRRASQYPRVGALADGGRGRRIGICLPQCASRRARRQASVNRFLLGRRNDVRSGDEG